MEKSAKRGMTTATRANFIAKQKRLRRDMLLRDLAFETTSPLDDFALGTKKEGRGGGNETTHGHETKGRMSGFKLKHLISTRWKAMASGSHKRKFPFHKRDGSFTKNFLLPARVAFRSPTETFCLSFLRLLSATRQSPDEPECKKTHSVLWRLTALRPYFAAGLPLSCAIVAFQKISV